MLRLQVSLWLVVDSKHTLRFQRLCGVRCVVCVSSPVFRVFRVFALCA